MRSRWLEALQRSKTLSEVALALSSLVEYSKSFGLMNEEEIEEMTSKQGRRNVGSNHRNGKGSGQISAAPHRKKKGKNSNTSVVAGRGRSQRSTRAVVVYGE